MILEPLKLQIAEREVAFYKIAFFIGRRVYVQDMEWSSTVADSPNRFNEIKPIYFRCSNDKFSITSRTHPTDER